MHQPPSHSTPDSGPRPPLGWLALLLVGAALLFGIGLGTNDLWAPDEPRYAAIAEELRSFRHGPRGLVLLHLGDLPYTQKPPLYFWIAALFGLPFDRVTELAARAPSAIAGIASVGLTAWIGRLLLGRWTPALVGAAMLATSFRFAFTARRAQLDVLLCAFELVAIALFLCLENRRGGIEQARRSPGSIVALHAALGAAAMVKGPVGWLPLLVFFGYLTWQGRVRAMRAIVPIWSWGFSIGPLALWALAAITLAPAGFADEAIGENLFGRFFSGTSHARPFYYYLLQTPMDFLPWSLVFPLGVPVVWRVATRTQPTPQPQPSEPAPDFQRGARFLICWAAIPLLFFSLSAGKRGLYLLPIFPALALISALAGSRSLAAGERLALRYSHLVRATAAVAVLELLLFSLALPRLGPEKSPRPIAVAAAAHTQPGEALGVYGMTPIEGGLLYYGVPRIASLRRQEDLEAFLADQGEWVLLRARHFEEFGAALGLREIESFRSGRRRLSLAHKAGTGPPQGFQSVF